MYDIKSIVLLHRYTFQKVIFFKGFSKVLFFRCQYWIQNSTKDIFTINLHHTASLRIRGHHSESFHIPPHPSASLCITPHHSASLRITQHHSASLRITLHQYIPIGITKHWSGNKIFSTNSKVSPKIYQQNSASLPVNPQFTSFFVTSLQFALF